METDLEEGGVLLEELGEVAVPEGTDEDHVLVLVWVLSLEGPRHHEDRLDGPHPKVIVVLLGELLAAQLVHLYHLLGQVLRGLEALGVEDHLSNQGYTEKCNSCSVWRERERERERERGRERERECCIKQLRCHYTPLTT